MSDAQESGSVSRRWWVAGAILVVCGGAVALASGVFEPHDARSAPAATAEPTIAPSATPEAPMTAAEPSETAGAATPDATEQQASPPQTTEAPKGESLKKPVDAVEGPIPPIGDIPAVPVSIDETAKPSKSSSIRLVSTKTVKAVGTGIGEISGPAIEVTIEISNSGSKTLKLDAADVSAYYGPAGVPASPVTSDPAHKALPESVPAGNSVRGVYIFGVPKDEREAVSIVVMTEHGSAPVIFAGKV